MTRLSALFYTLPLLAGVANATPVAPRGDGSGKPCPDKAGAAGHGGNKGGIGGHRGVGDGGSSNDGGAASWANFAADSTDTSGERWGWRNRGGRGGWGGGGGWGGDAGSQEQGKGQGQDQTQGGGERGDDVEVVYVDVTKTMTKEEPMPTRSEQDQGQGQAQRLANPQPDPAPQPQPTVKPDPAPQPQPQPEPDTKPDQQPEPAPAPAPAPGPGGDTQQLWIDLHTQARAKFGQGAVTWSDGAYQQAKANAEAAMGSGCKLKHTDGGKFGENLFWSSDGNGMGKEAGAMASWMDEAQYFNYDDPEGSHGGHAVGHFTAIVWTDVKAIGCYSAACSGSSGTYIACGYDPTPNWRGQYGAKVPRPV